MLDSISGTTGKRAARPKLIRYCLILALTAAVGSCQTSVTLVGTGFNLVPQPSLTMSPGQLTTFFVTGLKAVLPKGRIRATSLPLPTELAGISVRIEQTIYMFRGFTGSVPVLDISQANECLYAAVVPACLLTAITVQIPYELAPFTQTASPALQYSNVIIFENGQSSESFYVKPVAQSGHILNSCDFANLGGRGCALSITHPDGSNVSFYSPAKPGETLVMDMVGLGHTIPSATTGAASLAPAAVLKIPVGLEFAYNLLPGETVISDGAVAASPFT